MAVDAYYFTPDHLSSPIGLYCTTVGAADSPPGAEYPPQQGLHPAGYRGIKETGRVLDEHQLVHIRSGSGTFEYDDGDGGVAAGHAAAGDVLIIRRGQWHRYFPDPATGWTEYWVGFNGPAADPAIRAAGLMDAGPTVRVGQQPAIVGHYERMIGLSRDHHQTTGLAQSGVILELLSQIARDRGRGDDNSPGGIVMAAQAVMQEHMQNPVSVPHIAHRVGVSESTVRRGFHEITGMSPYRYYLRMRINQSMHRLAHTNESLQVIAERLGFTDQYHYSRVFKQLVGVSPSEWRRARG